MNPNVFFENFELLADAPNGVQKLRELILQLAVMGKLMPQDPNDESASVLLEKIKDEKEKLIKEGKIKGSKKLPEISDIEVLFEIPESWKWIRFDNICSYIQRGKSPKYIEESDFPVIAQKCIQWDGLKIDRAKFIDPLTIEKYEEERFLRTGDLLWNSTGTGTIGRVNVYAHDENTYDKVVADTHVTVVRPLLVDSCYIYCWIASSIVQRNIENIASGSTNQIELATSTVKSHVLPLPPLSEQKRIVSKVDELMALCDKLETRSQKKQEIQSKLNSAALDRMLSAENQEEFEQHWQRICENFDLLYDNPENVEKLKQAILQLAVQGRLVPQNPEDEPASVLIEKIEAEKEKLIKERKIKDVKISPILNITEVAYELPKGWEWCRWNDVSMQIGDLDHKMPPECEEGIPYVSPKDFYDNNGINFITAKKISREDFERLRQKIQPEINDIIFPRYGTIGENRFVTTENEFLASYSCAVIKSMNEMMEPKYSFYYSISPLVKSEITKYINKTTQPNVGLKSIQMFIYPLPPLAEQKRIVEKVEQLMSLCDELESKLRKEREDSEKLMVAVVKGLLEGAAPEKTELEEPIPLQVVTIQLK